MKRNFHLQRFDLASKGKLALQRNYRTQLDQYLVRIEAISERNDYSFRRLRLEGGTELQKKKQSWWW
jgi:hypothetical protein